jgi:hypothetical protein
MVPVANIALFDKTERKKHKKSDKTETNNCLGFDKTER